MPCHVDPPTAAEKHQRGEVHKQLEELNEKASHGADMLREYLLGNVATERILPLLNQNLVEEFNKLESIDRTHWLHVDEDEVFLVHGLIEQYEELNEMVTLKGREALTKKQLATIERKQTIHRGEDLARLAGRFAAEMDKDRLRKVIDADPSKPLAAQLGFDPDEF